ncbi:thiamine diphosphokinase [Thermotalea metallivorans]|uniref:Thiamine diphosphokinase n=1 Tax=Thermotalea metallivorans TaxID=520762 RepID=A0A140L617_9FIRM|nr:thiamine diphosphokinase [Thermotalea metallivorans]KXG75992.1 Thiamine pyrophosphokinase [Thermotalea metallivorans]
MKCVIISNGDIFDYEGAKKMILESDYVICADGAARHLLQMNICPHVIVGDFDSMDEEVMAYFQEKDVVFYKFPVRKDHTDTELALQYALTQKCSEIIFLGCIGSRMDHTLANITLLLALANQGIQGRIVNEHNEIFVINDGITLEGKEGEYISLIPFSEKVEGILLTGFEYPLDDATLEMGTSLGISNRLKETKGKISVKNGNLLVIRAKD